MVAQHYRWDFVGLSTDTKPTPATSEKVVDGSTFYCSDTSKLYVFCKDTWYERKALGGGGGGGTTYTAGDGIDITDDTISVDTDTIQEKLTAGTGIDITDNTISATGGGGGGPTVVQTTGTSTTDVMSQDATTKMMYPDIVNTPYTMAIGESAVRSTLGIAINGNIESTGKGVAIGEPGGLYASLGVNGQAYKGVALGASAGIGRGDNSVAVGYQAFCNSGQNSGNNIAIGYQTTAGNGSETSTIALGAYAKTTRTGEVNVGAGSSGTGYNSTNYRVIGGVHDGQLPQDAVTVAQVNSVIDAINSALSTNIPHIGASN